MAAGLLPARVGIEPAVPTALRTVLAPTRRVLFGPERPRAWSVVTKLAAVNGYWLETDPGRPYDVAIHASNDEVCELPPWPPVLNRACTNVSKTRAASVFERVFGYSLAVDPTTHAGPIVQKSDANATHDGLILDGPISASDVRDGYVYQRLVDTSDGAEVVDLRTPLYGGVVPLVYVMRRPAEARFAIANTSVTLHEPDAVFDAGELRQLSVFAVEMGVDYAELDVLRDRDGRIYVVDVATHPAGPPTALSKSEEAEALSRLAGALDDLCARAVRERAPSGSPGLG